MHQIHVAVVKLTFNFIGCFKIPHICIDEDNLVGMTIARSDGCPD